MNPWRLKYEEMVVKLHTKISSGATSLTDGRLSGDAFTLLTSK